MNLKKQVGKKKPSLKMGCAEGLAKYFLFITNLLIAILSLVVVGLSIWMLIDYPSFVDVLDASGDGDSYVFTAGVVVILVVAVLAFILSCFGCCGAAKENICMIGTVRDLFFFNCFAFGELNVLVLLLVLNPSGPPAGAGADGSDPGVRR